MPGEQNNNAETYESLFNKRSRQQLAHIIDPRNELLEPKEVPNLKSEFTQAEAFTAISKHIAQVFENEWPKTVQPTPPADDSDRERIRHEKEQSAWKKAKSLRERQYDDTRRFFTEQALRSWPGLRDSVPEEGRAKLPHPILPEDYPRFAQSLIWYLTIATDEQGVRLAKGPSDLAGKTLQDIQGIWNDTFTTSVTSAHLQKCDAKFLGQLIPEKTPLDQRYPDPENVIHHAEILARGTMEDGRGWTLRRMNSQAASMAYGNPSEKPNGSSLCFTWSGNRQNMFHQYRDGLLMIASDDGKTAYFMNAHKEMYNDMADEEVPLGDIFKTFPGLGAAMSQVIADNMDAQMMFIADSLFEKEDFEKRISLKEYLHIITDPEAWELAVKRNVISLIKVFFSDGLHSFFASKEAQENLFSKITAEGSEECQKEIARKLEAFNQRIEAWETAHDSKLPALVDALLAYGPKKFFNLAEGLNVLAEMLNQIVAEGSEEHKKAIAQKLQVFCQRIIQEHNREWTDELKALLEDEIGIYPVIEWRNACIDGIANGLKLTSEKKDWDLLLKLQERLNEDVRKDLPDIYKQIMTKVNEISPGLIAGLEDHEIAAIEADPDFDDPDFDEPDAWSYRR